MIILRKLCLLLKSRTVWTILALFMINGIAGIREFIPATALPLVDGILSIMAIYFRAKPRAKFE